MQEQKFIPEGWNQDFLGVTKENINQIIKDKTIIQGIVNKCDSEYNLHINMGNTYKGIIPKEEVEFFNINNKPNINSKIYQSKINKIVQFKIKEVKNNNTLILSRKDVEEEAINWMKKELKVGQVINGIVKSVQKYGAFIEIGGGVIALLHIEDISVARIKTPLERLSIGEKINVIVKSIDRENGRIFLTYKELLRNLGRKC